MSLSRFPIGSRVRVLPCAEWVDLDALATVGNVGTVTAHDDPYLVVTIKGHANPHHDEGWLLLPDEVEPAS